MCAFTGERLKTDLKAEYNQDMAKIKSADFDAMVKKLQERYQPSQNQVLLHYQFHQLKQEPGEKIDAFINKICQHADKCAFKCTNTSCTEKDQQKAQRKEHFQDNFKPAQGANKIMCCAGCGRRNCDRGPNCAAKNAFCNACGKRVIFLMSASKW